MLKLLSLWLVIISSYTTSSLDLSLHDTQEIFDQYSKMGKVMSIENFNTFINVIGLQTNDGKCSSVRASLLHFNVTDLSGLTPSAFRNVCPSVLNDLRKVDCQIDRRHEEKIQKPPVLPSNLHLDQILPIPALFSGEHGNVVVGVEDPNFNGTQSYGIASIKPKVWIASLISITVISLVGLLGVAIVPLVTKKFYNHVIHFLVALAVGSLTGDAFLHLLPHAIVASVLEETGTAKHKHDDSQTIFKGLAALGGVYFFFMAEKLVSLVSEYRSEVKSKKEQEKKRELSDGQKLLSVTEEPAKRKISNNTTYMRKQSAVERMMSKQMESGETLLTTGLSSKAMKSIDTMIRANESDMPDCPEGDTCEHPSRAVSREQLEQIELPTIKTTADPDENNHNHTEDHVVVDNTTVKKHGHGHSHGEVPDSVASVAWMVIMGDGLHNFSDGLAIGAAFAQSISGGLSTAVAVFCHELPHELGDFAVLLKTGMKVKQALLYNMLSSVLCFIGMLIGIALGNVQTASYWIFAIAGGMFIYIALVDMLPELSSANVKQGESRILHLVIQNIGLVTGVSIMLIIALYEETIKEKLDWGDI